MSPLLHQRKMKILMVLSISLAGVAFSANIPVKKNFACLNCLIRDRSQGIPDCFPDPSNTDCLACLASAAPLAGCFEDCSLARFKGNLDLTNRCEARPDPKGDCDVSNSDCDDGYQPSASKFLFGNCLCTCIPAFRII